MSSSSIRSIEALHYAVDSINADPDILPSIRLGFDLFSTNSCGDLNDLTQIAGRDAEPIVGVIANQGSQYIKEFFRQPWHNMVCVQLK